MAVFMSESQGLKESISKMQNDLTFRDDQLKEKARVEDELLAKIKACNETIQDLQQKLAST